MTVATAVASILLFLVAFGLSGIVAASTGAIATARGAVAAMRDASLDDARRERAVQRASIDLLRTFASIALRGVLVVAISLLPVWAAHALGLAPASAVFAFLSRWDVIVVASVVIVAGYLLRRRLWGRN